MERPEFLTRTPNVAASAFVAPNAMLIGDVTLERDASVWYFAVLRADIQRITIGEASNIQDGAVIHLSDEYGSHVGARVTIGHRAVVHACTIDDEVLVGMGAIIMDGSIVGARSIIGAGALVTQHQKIPSGSLVLGNPGRVVRALTSEEQLGIRRTADKYVCVARYHQEYLAEYGNP